MRVCMPTAGDKGMTEAVFNHFGSAPFFTIYDTESKSIQIVENGNHHHEHGACQPLGIVSTHKVDAIMTSGIGRRAVSLLNQGGVRVYRLEGDTVSEAIKKFEARELAEMNENDACGGHDHGHGCH